MLAGMDHRSDATRSENDDAPRYEIHVKGLLSERLLSAFPELRARTRNRETVLTGAMPDQSALHGVLARIEALGLELLEVRRARSKPGTGAEAVTDVSDAPDAGRAGDSSAEPRGGSRD